MGIKNITKLLKLHSGVYKTDLSIHLKDTRIAVDTPIYLSKCMYSYLPSYLNRLSDDDIRNFKRFSDEQIEEVCEGIVKRFMEVFKGYMRVTEATFIMIIEGTGKPLIKNKFAGARRQLTYKRHLERFEDYVKEGKMIEARRMLSNIDLISLDKLSESLMPKLDNVGIKYIIAPGESERFACHLRRTDKIDHILTTDTDCLAMGQSFINDIDSRNSVYTLVDYDVALTKLSFTPEQFMDLCIMCGCDYNDNIPRIGVMKAYKLIQEHNSIEHLKSLYNIDCLNHDVCRTLFSPISDESVH